MDIQLQRPHNDFLWLTEVGILGSVLYITIF